MGGIDRAGKRPADLLAYLVLLVRIEIRHGLDSAP
jgi:hypothetical protein